ncbi:hypothetical protein OR221_0853 [Microbacterium laevaniformans OR221]|nr:hypothetical protein OR221_0853 [Microbacterium laevaniformans OR221]
MSDTTTTDGTETTEGGEQKQEQTFTQADVDKIVRDRLAQQAKNKFGDYDELKTAAAGAKTVEQKLAELESKHAEAEARALRSDIAARHGISAEDRDLFLIGSDEATLDAQAKRLADREAARNKHGNVARREGTTTTTGKSDGDMRAFVRQLFGNSAD